MKDYRPLLSNVAIILEDLSDNFSEALGLQLNITEDDLTELVFDINEMFNEIDEEFNG